MLASEPPSLDTLTIRPCGLARSSGSSAWVTRHAPSRFVSSASVTMPRSASAAVCHVS
jgi:hypothetical protein